MVPLLKHNSKLLFVTPDEGRGRFPPNLTTLEGKCHCWAWSGGNTHRGYRTLPSLPQALPMLLEPPRHLGNLSNLSKCWPVLEAYDHRTIIPHPSCSSMLEQWIKKLRASLVVQWLRVCQCRGHGFGPWSGRIPHAAEQMGPWATITEPARLEPVLRNERGRDGGRPARRDEEWPPLAATRESPRTETKTQHSHK